MLKLGGHINSDLRQLIKGEVHRLSQMLHGTKGSHLLSPYQAQVARRGGRCPIPRNIQHQVGWGSVQPDLVEGVPAHCRGFGLDDL